MIIREKTSMTQKKIVSDFTVIGGGMAGISAAVSAARLGLKVALVEARDVLGGNASSENRVHYAGAGNQSLSYYAREAGIADEIKLHVFHMNPRYNFKEDYHLSDMALFSFVRNEKNITLYTGTAAYDVVTEKGCVRQVFARRTRTEEDFCFESPYFADASGDGIIGLLSGASYRMGREAKSEYGESMAPDKADDLTMGSCILFTVGKADHPIPFVRPDFAYDYRKDDILKWVERPQTGRSLPRSLDGCDGIWWLEYGGMQNTIADHDAIDLELKRLVYGFWDYVKNSGAYQNTEPYYIKWIAPAPAKRESRRFAAAYTLREQDVVERTPFYDTVSTGGWCIDVHDPGGVYGTADTSTFRALPGTYGIPYRCMYSKDVPNLFLCGRIAGTTHVAHGSVRVMQTLAAMAQAVGTAAYLCKRDGLLPRDVADKERVKELQKLLQRNGQYIPFLKEDVGKAAEATVTASSTARLTNPHGERQCPPGGYALAIPLKGTTFDSVELAFKNDTDEEKTVPARLFRLKRQDSYETGECLAETTVTLPPRADGFFPVVFHCENVPEHVAVIAVGKCDGVWLYATDRHVTGAPGFYAGENGICGRFHIYEEARKINHFCTPTFRNVLPDDDFYAPANVIDGISRPMGLPHVWRAPIEDDPTLTLTFDKPQDVNEIQILFNGQTENDHFSTCVETLVKDFDVKITLFDGSTQVFGETDNYLALRRFHQHFSDVTAIDICIHSTYENPYAEIFSVKIF